MPASVMNVSRYVGERAMTMGVFTLRRFAVLTFTSVCLGLGFGAAPAAAGCGYGYGWQAPAAGRVPASFSCRGWGPSYRYGYRYGGYGYGAYGGYCAYGGYASGSDAVVAAPYYRPYRRG